MQLRPPEPLNSGHDISDFDCERESLNVWLRAVALKSEARPDARTYVLIDDEDERVIAYHSLAVGSMSRERAKGKLARNGPDPVSVVLLARLAVDARYQSRGIGSYMVADALQRAVALTEIAGARAVTVNPIDDAAARFYQQVGFDELPNDPTTLYMMIADARATLETVI